MQALILNNGVDMPALGLGVFRRNGGASGQPNIADIAKTHGKTPAQVMLHWGLQHERSVIPKSTKPSRLAENIDVFDFGREIRSLSRRPRADGRPQRCT
jgi:diketogulonate reductase-like aldo/keto reductase